MMKKFVHLHTHSHYSLLDGLGKIGDLIARAKDLGMGALALTDHGVLYGAVEFYKKAKKAGIKPILGVEAYVAPKDHKQKNASDENKYYHLVLLAKNNYGWKNLIKLVTISHLDGFYYKPRVDKNLLRQHCGGLIALSACVSGEIPRHILNNKMAEAERAALEYQEIFGKGNFYLEIEHHPGIPGAAKVNEGLKKLSEKLGIPLVATHDIHYVKPADAGYHDILLAVQTGNKISDTERLTLKDDDFSMRSPEEMAEFFRDTPEAIANTEKIAEECNVELELDKLQLPKFDVPDNKTANNYLRELIGQRAAGRYPRLAKEIKDRINYELGIIEKTGFADYFLIVQDFVNWAKDRGIAVGPGRGCFLPNTKILLKNGRQKNIQDIKPKERVISALGNKRRVKEVLSYDIGEEIAVIKSKMPVFDLRLTKDHRVLAARHKMCCVKSIKDTICKPSCNRSCKKNLWINYELQWIQAKDLKKNDFLLYPIAKHRRIKKIKFDLLNFNNLDTRLKGNNKYVWYETGTNRLIQKKINRYIKLDKKFAQLIGFYIAEGWSRIRRKHREATIGFGFHRNEKEYIEKVKNLLKQIFGIESIVTFHKIKDSCQVFAYSRIAAKFLERLCGRDSQNKCIPHQIFESSEETIVALLTSLFKGDGSRKDAMRISFDSISPDLVSQVKMLLAQLGIMSSIKIRKYKEKRRNDSYKLTISGKQLLKFNKLFKEFRIPIKKQRFYRNDTFIWQNYIWFPVKKISFKKYKGRVYDLTVEKDSSYVANEIAVHNSAAGSIVSYILGITDIDPLRYNLLFERFLNPDRISMPDIDLDFADTRRDEVFGYLTEKYGKDCVAQIITFGTMAARAAVRDAGRAMGISYNFCDQIAKLIPFNAKLEDAIADVPELRNFYRDNSDAKRMLDAAKNLEGVARHASVHACGIVISKEPLINCLPLQYAPQGANTTISQFDMYSVEDLGLLKMDLLGLKNLTIIEDTIRLAKEMRDEEVNMSAVPLDDQKTFELLQAADTTGVFQLETSGMRRYLKELKPSELEDIIAMVALYRPGPMELIPQYIRRKFGKERIAYLHPKLEPILKKTYGVAIYQEQLMQIARDLAGFTLSEADTLRKAVGKKIKSLLDEQSKKMIDGMMRNGINGKIAEQIWQWFEPFARYGFNRCLTGDTEIINAQTGQKIKLEDLYKNRDLAKKTYTLGENFKIKIEKILDVIHNGQKIIFKVRTRSGRTIQATANHPFLTEKGWQKLEDIEVCTRIAVPRYIPQSPKSITVEPHKIAALGYLLAEGNFCHPNGFYFYSKSEEEVKDYLQCLERFKNTVGKIDRSKSAIAVYAKRKNVKEKSEAVEWINSLGLKNKNATKKFFPDFIFCLNNYQLAMLIGKLFQGDGCINLKRQYPQIFYATSSIDIARGLQQLLLRFNILSTIHRKKFKYRGNIKIGYTVTINRYDNISKFIETFHDHLVGEKKTALEIIKNSHPIINGSVKTWAARGSKDIIPANIILPIMRTAAVQSGINFSETACAHSFSKRLLSNDNRKIGYLRETVNVIAHALQNNDLQTHAESDIYWDEIVSIKSNGVKNTYDLTIENAHNFIANNIFVHNSHAACYATIAYRTAYLRAHYPVEFYTGLFNADAGDVERAAFLINEARKIGINVLPPDINKSVSNFVPEEGNIRFGLLAIKNVGKNIVEAIATVRQKGGPFKNFVDFLERVDHKDLNKKSLESLIKCGALDSLGTERNCGLTNIEEIISFASTIRKSKQASQFSLFGHSVSSSALKLKLCPPASAQDKLAWEKELLGLYISDHPLNQYRNKIILTKAKPIKEILSPNYQLPITNYQTSIAGIISKMQRVVTKLGQPMMFAKIEDFDNAVEVLVFADTLEKTLPIWRENNAVLVSGRMSWRNGEPKLICDSAKEL